jgi:multiple sugar transport system ATP-binding protein
VARVELRGVSKRFGRSEVVSDVDLDVADGELMVLVGPSGCGKSTVLRLVAGLEDPSAGDLLIDGVRVNDRLPSERGIAMVFQSYALYPHMTVYENMAFGLRLARRSRETIEARVREAARLLGLEPLLGRRPRELSGGQRQRVAIGRAITREPRVFLLDEPLSNLDAALRVQTRLEIARLKARLGATMIYVTHDQVEAMTLADRIAVMRAGRVEQVGLPLELYARPRNVFVAGFIGSPAMNLLDGAVEASGPGSIAIALPGAARVAVPVAPAANPPPAGTRVTVGVRPEHAVLAPAREATRGDGVLAGRVLAIERLGAEGHVHLAVDGGRTVVVRVEAATGAAVGDGVAVRLDPARCHVFGADGAAFEQPAG